MKHRKAKRQIESPYYTTEEAAEKLGVHSTTVRTWASEGLLETELKGCNGAGNTYLFSRAYIDRLSRQYGEWKVPARKLKKLKQNLAKKTHHNMK